MLMQDAPAQAGTKVVTDELCKRATAAKALFVQRGRG